MDTLTTDALLASHYPAAIIPSQPSSKYFSHIQLIRLVDDFEEKLRFMQVRPQDTVAIALPNSLEFLVTFLAATSHAAVAAPLNPGYKQSEFEFYLDDLKPSVLIVPHGWLSQHSSAIQAAQACKVPIAEVQFDGNDVLVSEYVKMSRVVEEVLPRKPRASDIAMVLHTSGTTGRPKIVPLTHKNLTRSCANIEATYNMGPSDRGLLVMPLFHVHGLMAGLLAPILAGGSVIIPAKFSAQDFWTNFCDNHANWYTAVPTIHQIILKNPVPDPLPKIRFIRSCSSPFAPSFLRQLEEKLGAPVLEAYAMTEAAHQMTSNPLPPAERKPGSVGIPQNVELKIMDSEGHEVPVGSKGEICIRGENVTSGYYNNPTANETAFFEGGFFRTGDQGTVDAEGYVSITGRLKEMINKGGEKVSPIDLDNLYVQHEAIAEAVCFGVPDALYGQDIGVAVVLKEGQQLDHKEFKSWVAERAIKFKVPKEIFVVDVMPKTATGKVQRRIVADTVLIKTTSETSTIVVEKKTEVVKKHVRFADEVSLAPATPTAVRHSIKVSTTTETETSTTTETEIYNEKETEVYTTKGTEVVSEDPYGFMGFIAPTLRRVAVFGIGFGLLGMANTLRSSMIRI